MPGSGLSEAAALCDEALIKFEHEVEFISNVRGSEWPALNAGTAACYTNFAAVTRGHSLPRTVPNAVASGHAF
jgi:hypothetical protein